MEIAIFSAGLPHAERTLEVKSLGGSETAALMVAKGLAKRGHTVTLYSQFPAPGSPDAIQPSHVGADGVRYMPLEAYSQGVTGAPLDLLIVSRDPNALSLPHQARKAVLWMHDLAVERLKPALDPVAWNLDEIWAVSEFHRQQIAQETGFPVSHIRAMRNGIIELPEPELEIERDPTLLYYGSRPERGLIHLLAPGGIMERLPEYRLEWSMYGEQGRFPEPVKELYAYLLQRSAELPNVEMIGYLTQGQVRDKLREAGALVYPSDFEETSCILVREAISVECPIIASGCGAMPETLAGCGYIMPRRSQYENEEEFSQAWADNIRWLIQSDEGQATMDLYAEAQRARTDLTWDGAVDRMEMFGRLGPVRPLLAQAQALVEVGDVIPAIELLKDARSELTPRAAAYLENLEMRYEAVIDPATAPDAYADRYEAEGSTYGDLRQNRRFIALANLIGSLGLEAGSTVLDYGCCEGNYMINLALAFPTLHFVGFDHAPETYAQGARAAENAGVRERVTFTCNRAELGRRSFDVVMMNEVLEHVAEPWSLIDDVEMYAKVGALAVSTTPIGPWEIQRLRTRDGYDRPEHLWHLDKDAMEVMLAKKEGVRLTYLPDHIDDDTMLVRGNLMCLWRTTGKRAAPLKPLLKKTPRPQNCAAAMICMNDEADILRCLKSVAKAGIEFVRIAIGPSTDNTNTMIDLFRLTHPWVQVERVSVPKIEAGKFGFDDARNASIEGLDRDFEWALWIDSDEELIGRPRRYLRESYFDSFAVHQHHFTVEPRGVPAMIDRPARFIRLERGFKFAGKVHEHAELGGVNGGPGQSMVLPNVDLFHIGYKNEAVRKSRFWRNLAFLQWDRRVNPDRNLGKYLWLRDLIHQMRYANEGGHRDAATAFALEAVRFYNEHWQDMLHFGNGLVQGFQYVSEARRYLGRGIAVQQQITLEDGRAVQLQGQIEDPSELTRLIDHVLSDECKKARSRYR